MKKTIILSGLLWLGISSCDEHKNDSITIAKKQNKEMAVNNNIEKDAEFAVKAASGGLMEVQLGNLAISNGSSQAVKDFGSGMVNDHSAANGELMSLASSKNIALPDVPGNEHQKEIDKLKSKTGSDFDKAYMEFMVKDHKEDIDLFQKETDNGMDQDLKSWAAQKIPVLQHHLQMAEQIEKSL